MCSREKGFVLRGHCQNLLDDPRIQKKNRGPLRNNWSKVNKPQAIYK